MLRSAAQEYGRVPAPNFAWTNVGPRQNIAGEFDDGTSADRDSQANVRVGSDRGTVADSDRGTDEDRCILPETRECVGHEHASAAKNNVVANLGEIGIIDKAGQENILADLGTGRIGQ